MLEKIRIDANGTKLVGRSSIKPHALDSITKKKPGSVARWRAAGQFDSEPSTRAVATMTPPTKASYGGVDSPDAGFAALAGGAVPAM